MVRTKGSLEGKIQLVNLQQLEIDPSYQREKKANQRRIVEDWNPQAAGILVCGYRGNEIDKLFVVDGQQRRAAMISLGIFKWNALVFQSHGVEHEAHVFKLLNDPRYRIGLTTREMFKSLLVAQDPTAIGVLKTIHDAGLEFSYRNRKWPKICCVKAMMKIYDTRNENDQHVGPDHLKRVFNIIVKAWPQQDASLYDFITIGLGRLIRYNPQMDDDRMIVQLTKFAASKVVSEVTVTTANRQTKAAEVLAEYYNRGLAKNNQNRLVYQFDRVKKKDDTD